MLLSFLPDSERESERAGERGFSTWLFPFWFRQLFTVFHRELALEIPSLRVLPFLAAPPSPYLCPETHLNKKLEAPTNGRCKPCFAPL